MEISTISLPRMNNGAHFLYNTDFYNRIEADTKVKNKVAEVLTRYKQAIDHEDEALTISRKSLNTGKIVEYDRRRDSLYVGIKSIVKAQLTVSDPEIQNAAREINQIIKDYNINVKTQLDKETGLLINFIDDMENKYADQVQKLALGSFINQLKQSNSYVRSYTASRNDERLSNPEYTLKEARKVTDEVYLEVVKLINAYAVIEGDTDYKALIAVQNQEIVHYKQQVLKQSVPPVPGDPTAPIEPDAPPGDRIILQSCGVLLINTDRKVAFVANIENYQSAVFLSIS